MNRLRTISLFVLTGLATNMARAEDMLPPSIIHEACQDYLKGKAFEIVARFEDESQLFDPKVMYRASGDSHWKQSVFVKESGSQEFRATIKVRDLKGVVEYFIEVFDEFGNGPARMGSPEAPIRVSPSKSPEPCEQVPVTARPLTVASGSPASTNPAGAGTTTLPETRPGANIMTQPIVPPSQRTCDRSDRPLYCEPWLWATLGAVLVVGGGVGLYFLVRPNEELPQSRESIRLRITGPDPTEVTPNP